LILLTFVDLHVYLSHIQAPANPRRPSDQAAVLAEAKIEKFRWHDLRHTFASRLVEAGANMKVVQEACGHASITMTARYAHVSNKTLHDAMSLLNRNKQAVPSAA